MKRTFPEQKWIQIIEILKKKPLSIAELCRATGMKRATFIHYLKQIEAQGFLKRKRMEKLKGRPTLIEFDKDAWEKIRKDFNEQRKKEEKEVYEAYSKNPLTLKILQAIKDNPKIDWAELLEIAEIRNYADKFLVVKWLHESGLIRESFSITEEGKKLLSEHEHR